MVDFHYRYRGLAALQLKIVVLNMYTGLEKDAN